MSAIYHLEKGSTCSHATNWLYNSGSCPAAAAAPTKAVVSDNSVAGKSLATKASHPDIKAAADKPSLSIADRLAASLKGFFNPTAAAAGDAVAADNSTTTTEAGNETKTEAPAANSTTTDSAAGNETKAAEPAAAGNETQAAEPAAAGNETQAAKPAEPAAGNETKTEAAPASGVPPPAASGNATANRKSLLDGIHKDEKGPDLNPLRHQVENLQQQTSQIKNEVHDLAQNMGKLVEVWKGEKANVEQAKKAVHGLPKPPVSVSKVVAIGAPAADAPAPAPAAGEPAPAPAPDAEPAPAPATFLQKSENARLAAAMKEQSQLQEGVQEVKSLLGRLAAKTRN